MLEHEWQEPEFFLGRTVLDARTGRYVHVDRLRVCRRCGVSDLAAGHFGWTHCNGERR